MFTKSGIGNRKCFKLFQSDREEVGSGSARSIDRLIIPELWVSIEPLRGQRLIEAQQIASGVTHRMKSGWFKPKPDQTYFFERGGIRYTIQSVININEDNVEYEYLVTERTP